MLGADFWYTMLGYVLVIVSILVGLNWITKGFIFSFIRVKGSRGKKILTMLHSNTDTYFKVGQFDINEERQNSFCYTNREKVKKVVTDACKQDLFNCMTVFWIEIDDAQDKLIRRLDGVLLNTEDGVRIVKNAYPSTSPEKADKMIDRAIKLPRNNDIFRKVVMGSLMIIGVLIIIDIYMSYVGMKNTSHAIQLIGNVSTQIRTII
jgi:hypothetical protein